MLCKLTKNRQKHTIELIFPQENIFTLIFYDFASQNNFFLNDLNEINTF